MHESMNQVFLELFAICLRNGSLSVTPLFVYIIIVLCPKHLNARDQYLHQKKLHLFHAAKTWG